MSLGPRLDLRQSQSLVMTPQLQQAIRLLALSNLEIEGVIAEEIERNPLLESGGSDDPGGEDASPGDAPLVRDEPAWAAALRIASGLMYGRPRAAPTLLQEDGLLVDSAHRKP